jgi:Na+/melibiose symporter-like transporter
MTSDGPAQAGHVPPLGTGARLAYGVGQLADGIRVSGFGIFLFFYYVQVLGLPPELGGTAIFIAVMFDAVTDPIAGYISDSWHSRWGRRHPFMYASAIPVAIAFHFTFVPPSGLSETQLFAWLVGTSIATRAAMTLFVVPHYALGAELSQDRAERTAVVSLRYAFFSVGNLMVYGSLVLFFATGADGLNGQLISENYPPFARTAAFVMMASILVCALGTHHRIPYLAKPMTTGRPSRPVLGVFIDLWVALKNRNFRFVALGALFDALLLGSQMNLMLFVYTYFWELSADVMTSVFVASSIGVFLGSAVLAPPVSARFERRTLACFGVAWYVVFNIAPIALRLVGWFPENGTATLATTLIALNLIGGMGVVLGYVAQGTMIAEVADEHDLATGNRQEGVFYAALSFPRTWPQRPSYISAFSSARWSQSSASWRSHAIRSIASTMRATPRSSLR